MANIHHATVKVMKSGRITIPSEIRDLENIKEGSYLRIRIEKIEGAKAEPKKAKKKEPQT